MFFQFLKPLRRWYFFLYVTLLACGSTESTDYSRFKTDPPPGKFVNPVLTSGPDPWVIQKDGFYFFCHTTGFDLRIYRSETMSDIAKAVNKVVWSPPATGMNSKNIWAPELHFIDDKWYLYFAADDGLNENHRIWVLENLSPDPFQGAWTEKGEVQLPDDKWAIDGSAFEHQGNLYLMWSGWEGDVNVRQDIYIAKMLNPWMAEGARIRLSKPEFSWELHAPSPTVNEGPQILKRGDKMFIVYSASGCWTDHYALGMLTADTAANVLDPASWTKSAQPVFTSNPEGNAYAPGHNSFFTSPDGTEDWIIYHANSLAGQGCSDKRSVRMQKFTWTSEGIPYFGQPVSLGEFLDKPSGEL